MSSDILISLHVRDLTASDLPHCTWAGSALHLRSVARELDRAATGAADYLAVCVGRSDLPVAIGGIDYEHIPGAGSIHQLATLPALQSQGLGTILVQAAEDRIRRRGLARAELGVELENPRARALYERLGYVAYDEQPDAWDMEEPDGTVRRYETICTCMAKELPPRAAA